MDENRLTLLLAWRCRLRGFGGGVMDGECLRLLLQGGDSGSACSKLGRMSVMLQGALF